MAMFLRIRIASRYTVCALIFALMTTVFLSEGAASPEQIYFGTHRKEIEAQCLTPKEAELLKIVNAARLKRGLSALAVSKSLVKVARTHVFDLQENAPNSGQDRRGINCNMHSWSSDGYWTPVCYTADHRYANLMRSKPAEITKNAFRGIGYEVVYWSSAGQVDSARAVASWLRSPLHRTMILQTGKWSGTVLKSVGVGTSDNFASVWVSPGSDPQGGLLPCKNE